MITRYGVILTFTGVGICFLGRLFGVLELYVVGSGLVALVVVCFALVRFGRVRLRVARRVTPSRVFVDEPARVELVVRNAGSHATPVLKLTDPVSGTPGATLSVSPIRAGSGSKAAYKLPTTRRGRVQIGPMSLERRDPFGLARRTLPAAGVSEVTVYPSWHRLPFPGQGAGVGPLSEHLRLRALGRHGEEFHALRAYAPGDDLRRIHWKQSARTDELKVKETDTRAVRRLGVVLDVDPSRHTPESFERAVSAAASFVASAEEAGYAIRAGMASSLTGSTLDLDSYLEDLALVEPSAGRPLGDTVADVSRWLNGGALVLITGRPTPEVVAATRSAAPGADAGVLVACERGVAVDPRGIFVVDGSTPSALVASWSRLVGVAPTRPAAPPRAAPDSELVG